MQSRGSLVQRRQRFHGGPQRILVGGQLNDARKTQFPLKLFNRLPGNIGSERNNVWMNVQRHDINCGPDRNPGLS